MASFEVVAVYPSGRRFVVREPHDTYLRAVAHLSACQADGALDWTYEIDARYIGADGQRHFRSNVTPESLGYTDEEVAAYRWDCV